MTKRKIADAIVATSAAPSTTTTMARPTGAGNFESLSNELVGKILSFLDFKCRVNSARPVNRRLKSAIDSMPPEELCVEVTFGEHSLISAAATDAAAAEEEDDHQSFVVDGATVNLNWDILRRTLNVYRNVQSVRSYQVDYTSATDDALLAFPTVSSVGLGVPIQKMFLHLDWTLLPFFFNSSTSSSSKHLGLKQWKMSDDEVLTELTLRGLTGKAAILMRSRIPLFQRVKKLNLLNPHAPLSVLLPHLMTTVVKGITEVAIELTDGLIPNYHPDSFFSDEEQQAVCRPLSTLVACRNLESVTITADGETDMDCEGSIISGLLRGLAGITQLKRFHYDRVNLWNVENCHSFAYMLSCLSNLEEFTWISACHFRENEPSVWDAVEAAGVKTSPVKRFGMEFLEDCEDELEPFVAGCIKFFPSLTHLEISLINHHGVEVDQASDHLAGLRDHPSLRLVSFRINYPWEPQDEERFVRNCKNNYVGTEITVESTYVIR